MVGVNRTLRYDQYGVLEYLAMFVFVRAPVFTSTIEFVTAAQAKPYSKSITGVGLKFTRQSFSKPRNLLLVTAPVNGVPVCE